MSFEPGAPQSPNTIPLCVPNIGGNATRYVQECLDTGWVSSVGKYVERFEQQMAQQLGTGHAVATVNGTSALHVALLVAGVKPDDEVLVSTLTFIATANAVRYAGAWPVPLDAEPRYWQLDAEQVADFCRRRCTWRNGKLVNNATGRRVSAIVPAHILGHPVDVDPIREVAQQFELPVVEDAAEGLGARYRQRPVGTLGHIAALSFNGNKLITTGGGGMIVTDRGEWAERARYLTTQAKDDPVEYVHGTLGFNYRLTNLQAALGCAQLEQLDEHLTSKRRIALRYAQGLADVRGITVMPEAAWAESAWWLYTVLIDEAAFGCSSRQLLKRLAARGIQTRPLWQPMHRSPVHAGGAQVGCPVADALQRDALSLPCSVQLTVEEQDRVIRTIRELQQSSTAHAA